MGTDLLQSAYEAGWRSIASDRDSAHVPAESFQAIATVERHGWHWRLYRSRLILIAESHVYSSDADLAIKLNQEKIALGLTAGVQLPPDEYVGLV